MFFPKFEIEGANLAPKSKLKTDNYFEDEDYLRSSHVLSNSFVKAEDPMYSPFRMGAFLDAYLTSDRIDFLERLSKDEGDTMLKFVTESGQMYYIEFEWLKHLFEAEQALLEIQKQLGIKSFEFQKVFKKDVEINGIVYRCKVKVDLLATFADGSQRAYDLKTMKSGKLQAKQHAQQYFYSLVSDLPTGFFVWNTETRKMSVVETNMGIGHQTFIREHFDRIQNLKQYES